MTKFSSALWTLGCLTLFICSGQKVFAADFTFNFNSQKFVADQTVLDSWLGGQTVGSSNILEPASPSLKASLLQFLGQSAPKQGLLLIYHHRLEPVYNYLQNLSEQINQKTQEPVLEIQDNRASTFIPPQDGVKVDIFQNSLATLRALELERTTLDLAAFQTEPKNSLKDTNGLGINELIAEGVSNFAGSPKNRRFNIAAGVEKFKGVIIPQGATFSFDGVLGPVDGEHGFLPELVIKKNDTVPEFGGGLCQVSTTTFRAAMHAGLPIVERKNHAYAVQYYSPQGTDATIYPGAVDLKFINDTPGAILIWPYEKDSNTLVFDFYGTNDGRQVTLEKPVQTDRLPDGSLKASWTRVVIKDGTPRTDIFKSIYQSPALFHKTEQFVTASNTPASVH